MNHLVVINIAQVVVSPLESKQVKVVGGTEIAINFGEQSDLATKVFLNIAREFQELKEQLGGLGGKADSGRGEEAESKTDGGTDEISRDTGSRADTLLDSAAPEKVPEPDTEGSN